MREVQISPLQPAVFSINYNNAGQYFIVRIFIISYNESTYLCPEIVQSVISSLKAVKHLLARFNPEIIQTEE